MNNECIEQAQRYLVMRDHNHNELRTKLKQKGYSDSDIDETFAYLEELKFLDEARYVRSFVRSNNRRHPEGKFIMLQRLLSKGADAATSKQELAEIYTEEYTDALIEQASDRLSRHGKPCDRAALAKLGFTSSEIFRTLHD